MYCSDMKKSKKINMAQPITTLTSVAYIWTLTGVGWEEEKDLKPCRCFALQNSEG